MNSTILQFQTLNKEIQLFEGDSLELLETLDPESIDCIWTDPPYRLSNDGNTCVGGTWKSVNKGKWDRSQGVQQDLEWNRSWLKACHRVLTPAGTIWVTGTVHIYPSVGMALQELGFRILNDIIWEKPAPPPNLGCRCFTHSTEILLWATKAQKGSPHRYTFNYQDMKKENDDKQMKNVWRFGPPSAEEKRYGKHPTQKPIKLIERCLKASTNPGDLILDPFAGSGSVGVASMLHHRRFIGCDNNEDSIELAIARLENLYFTLRKLRQYQ